MMAQMTGWWRRNWRRGAVLVIVSIVLLLAVRTVSGWWIRRQIDHEVARLERAYGSLNTRSMNPPLVPGTENRARIMRGAAELTAFDLTAKTMEMGRYLAAVSRPAAVTDQMRQIVEQNKLALYVAMQGRTLPRATWELSFFRGETSYMPANLTRLNMLLGAACRVDLEDGHLDRAVEVALTGLAEASSMRNEWATQMQSYRIAAVRQQLGCVQEMLQRAEPSAQALSDLAAALTDSRWPDPTRMGLIGELKTANAWFMELEQGRAVEYPWATSLRRAGPVNWLFRPIVSYHRLRDLRTLDRFIQIQAVAPYQREAAQTRPSAPSPEERREFQAFQESRSPLLKVLRMTFALAPMRWNEIEAGWEFHSALNAVETSVALRRYRLDHGSYPDALPQLVPQYLPWVPIDPFTGRPLEYAKQAGGFELHAHRAKGMNGGYGQALFDWRIPR